MKAYYNEHDRFAAAWLRELIKAGLIADGVVDERDIQQIEATELREFTQCHFFAGIGVWSYALRAAGWSDDTPVWTGSCPCQSFSASGKREGFSDERHLWPAWFRLLRECRPDTVFGEQVASKDGLAWFDIVSSDLEGEGYAVGAADTCAAGYGCPGIRQRLYFVADAKGERRQQHAGSSAITASQVRREINIGRSAPQAHFASSDSHVSRMADSAHIRHERNRRTRGGRSGLADGIELGNAERYGLQGSPSQVLCEEGRRQEGAEIGQPGPSLLNGFWRDAEWLWCRDQKYRPVEAGTFPLATGVKNRVGKLRGYGNALNAEAAKGFIEAYMDVANAG